MGSIGAERMERAALPDASDTTIGSRAADAEGAWLAHEVITWTVRIRSIAITAIHRGLRVISGILALSGATYEIACMRP
jgi:hypothetical protein